MIRASVFIALCLAVTAAISQSSPATRETASLPPLSTTDAQKYIAAQFGRAYTLLSQFPILVADFDGDNAEDIALVATAKDAMLDQAEYHYAVIDPYNSFFGFGDPRVTSRFIVEEGDPRLVLIVQGWRLKTPKAKYAVINLPFEKITVSRVLANKRKKRVVPCLELLDRTGLSADLFWSGKQWKWLDKSLDMDY